MPPTLIVVSGPAGTGKTTLAHELARAVGCPAVCRDEIKEGMVHATPGFAPSPGDPLTMRTLTTFFEVLGLLLRAGVTVVAEAAFQDRVWRPRLEPLTGLAELRVVRCSVGTTVAHGRIARRTGEHATRGAHDDGELLRRLACGEDLFAGFVPIRMDVPTLDVDTTDGYDPGLPDIVTFARTGRTS